MPTHLILLVFSLVFFVVAAFLDSPFPAPPRPGGHLFGWLGGAFLAASFLVP